MENQELHHNITKETMENRNKQTNFQGARLNSSIEMDRQNNLRAKRGFNTNPYITNTTYNENISTTANPYYNNVNIDQMQNIAQPKSITDSLLNSFDTENFIKGALIGALGAYLLTNEKAQKTIFKGIAKTTSMFQAGIEEIKERFEDAKAELEAEREA